MPFSAVIVGIGEGTTFLLAPRDENAHERMTNYVEYVNKNVPTQDTGFVQNIGEEENEDAFKDMKILDADATILTDFEGKQASRDIVQFV